MIGGANGCSDGMTGGANGCLVGGVDWWATIMDGGVGNVRDRLPNHPRTLIDATLRIASVTRSNAVALPNPIHGCATNEVTVLASHAFAMTWPQTTVELHVQRPWLRSVLPAGPSRINRAASSDTGGHSHARPPGRVGEPFNCMHKSCNHWLPLGDWGGVGARINGGAHGCSDCWVTGGANGCLVGMMGGANGRLVEDGVAGYHLARRPNHP